MKKFAFNGALCAAITAAVFVAAPAHARSYIGAGVTLDNVQADGDYEGIGFSGIGGTVFTGYDMPIGSTVFAGVEANADLYTADVAGIDAQWGWGVSGRVGANLNSSSKVYGRVGYARGKIEGEWGDAVRYGAGIETGLTNTISLRAEFTQFNYEQNLINNQVTAGLLFGF